MDFNPAWSTGDILAMIFSPPAFHEAETNCAHLGQFKDGFVSMTHRLAEQLCKFLVVEDLQTASGWDLAHGCRMKSMVAIAVTTLNKYAAFAKTFSKHFATNIVEMQSYKKQSTYRYLIGDKGAKSLKG